MGVARGLGNRRSTGQAAELSGRIKNEDRTDLRYIDRMKRWSGGEGCEDDRNGNCITKATMGRDGIGVDVMGVGVTDQSDRGRQREGDT